MSRVRLNYIWVLLLPPAKCVGRQDQWINLIVKLRLKSQNF